MQTKWLTNLKRHIKLKHSKNSNEYFENIKQEDQTDQVVKLEKQGKHGKKENVKGKPFIDKENKENERNLILKAKEDIKDLLKILQEEGSERLSELKRVN